MNMNTRIVLLGVAASMFSWVLAAEPAPVNPRIDYPGFQRLVDETAPVREAHRLSEAAFLEMMLRPGVVLLDARTESRYRQLHIAGAISLPFTEFTAESLASVIPSFDTPVLIYCNNNFADRLDVFPTKGITVSLNVSTYTSLRAYGYTRIYELGPLLTVSESRLPFAGDTADSSTRLSLPKTGSMDPRGVGHRFDPRVVAYRALAATRDAVSPAEAPASPAP